MVIHKRISSTFLLGKVQGRKMIFFIPLSQESTTMGILDNDIESLSSNSQHFVCNLKLKSAARLGNYCASCMLIHVIGLHPKNISSWSLEG